MSRLKGWERKLPRLAAKEKSRSIEYSATSRNEAGAVPRGYSDFEHESAGRLFSPAARITGRTIGKTTQYFSGSEVLLDTAQGERCPVSAEFSAQSSRTDQPSGTPSRTAVTFTQLLVLSQTGENRGRCPGRRRSSPRRDWQSRKHLIKSSYHDRSRELTRTDTATLAAADGER